VLGLTVHSVLHRFTATGGSDWTVGSPLVDEASAASLLAPVGGRDVQVTVEPEDEPLLDALAVDGRAGVTDLARDLGWTPGRTARRLSTLLAGNVVYIDCDVALELLGYTTVLEAWLTVEPGALARVGAEIATLPEVVYAAAVTGTVNLVAFGVFRSGDEIYRFVTERIGAMDGVQTVETVPTLRWVKQAGSLMRGERLTGTARRAPARTAVRGATPGRTSASPR
jgi:DNA-binding Lrp family transcriptional regulator